MFLFHRPRRVTIEQMEEDIREWKEKVKKYSKQIELMKNNIYRKEKKTRESDEIHRKSSKLSRRKAITNHEEQLAALRAGHETTQDLFEMIMKMIQEGDGNLEFTDFAYKILYAESNLRGGGIQEVTSQMVHNLVAEKKSPRIQNRMVRLAKEDFQQALKSMKSWTSRIFYSVPVLIASAVIFKFVRVELLICLVIIPVCFLSVDRLR